MVNVLFALMVVATPPSTGSHSHGAVSGGVLQDGVAMPLDGAHHRFTTTVRRKGSNYGTEDMVLLLHRAAHTVGNIVPGPPPWFSAVSANAGEDV